MVDPLLQVESVAKVRSIRRARRDGRARAAPGRSPVAAPRATTVSVNAITRDRVPTLISSAVASINAALLVEG